LRRFRLALESVGRHPVGRIALFCLTPLVVIGLEASRRAGLVVPLPFGMVYASIAISAGLGGIRIGVVSAGTAAAFIVHSAFVGFGPTTITGGPIQVVLGIIVASTLAGTLGRQRDTSSRLIEELSQARRELESRKASLEGEVAARTKAYRKLAERALQIQEDERAFLSRELHDELGQSLVAMKLRVAMAQRNPERSEIWEDIFGLLDTLVDQTRSLSLLLRPELIDRFGLSAAIRWYVEQQAERSSLVAKMSLDDVPRTVPGPTVMLCFRCVQEAVTNVIKHANADSINVSLRMEDRTIHLCVEDDGDGFQVPEEWSVTDEGGFGIPGIQERFRLVGGTFSIDSVPSSGTTVRASVTTPTFVEDVKDQSLAAETDAA